MKLMDLRNAVKEIEFDEERQEQIIREIQAKKSFCSLYSGGRAFKRASARCG